MVRRELRKSRKKILSKYKEGRIMIDDERNHYLTSGTLGTSGCVLEI